MSIFPYLSILSSFIIAACSAPNTAKVPVTLTWQNEGCNAKSGYYDQTFIIKNTSDKEIGNNWCIYYSQLPREIKDIQSDEIQIETINANFYKISPAGKYKLIAPQDSIVVKYSVTNDVPNVSQLPEGCYWVSTVSEKESAPMPIELQFRTISGKERMHTLSPQEIYRKNDSLNTSVTLSETDILPTVKKIIKGEQKKIRIPQKISLLYGNELANEAKMLQEKLKQLYQIEVSEAAPFSIRLDLPTKDVAATNKEQYTLHINTEQICIEGATPHGVFNGTQTLLSILKGKKGCNELECQTIIDYPDLEYRGLMLDIARNFTSAENLKILIDLLASYKLNVLHLHFSDDEGWRIEIPGLEELTEVGARRGHTLNEATCLYPGYDGGYNPNATTSGNGYYSRKDFIDLLKYAAQRHVRVIPEIESPGHARAAIVSMQARYNKYAGTDKEKACEYLLSEPADTSTYTSAQSYTDNVINVALPSTYRFMEKVITEIRAMYMEAGVDLSTIHIGGDEVPEGAWLGSPACRKLMKEQNMQNSHELFEYFFCRISDYLSKQGLKFGGWQEIALHNATQTDQRLRKAAGGIYCWCTDPYQIADAGYPVIICNVDNFYLDLAYSPHFEERGHTWAGYVDEATTFSLLPSRETDNIKGVQAQLFSETIRSFQWVEYYIFPKILGLVERGWNTHPTIDLSHFYALISDKEMTYLNKLNVNFRLPHPGLMMQGEYLYANSPIRNAEIRYTTDGSEPGTQSPVWKAPIKCKAAVIKARLFHLRKESVTTILINQ